MARLWESALRGWTPKLSGGRFLHFPHPFDRRRSDRHYHHVHSPLHLRSNLLPRAHICHRPHSGYLVDLVLLLDFHPFSRDSVIDWCILLLCHFNMASKLSSPMLNWYFKSLISFCKSFFWGVAETWSNWTFTSATRNAVLTCSYFSVS